MNKFLLVILLQVNCNKNSTEKTKKIQGKRNLING